MLILLLNKSSTNLKILVIFSDGNTEDENGDVMDTFRLEQSAKLLRDDHNIQIFGAIIPNSQNTQRIQELKGIASEKQDVITVPFSAANLNDIADRLVARVKQFMTCPGNNFILIHKTSKSFTGALSSYYSVKN